MEVAALCDTLRQRGVRVVVAPAGLAPQPGKSNATSSSVDDVTEAILYVLTRPPHLSIAELLLQSTNRPA